MTVQPVKPFLIPELLWLITCAMDPREKYLFLDALHQDSRYRELVRWIRSFTSKVTIPIAIKEFFDEDRRQEYVITINDFREDQREWFPNIPNVPENETTKSCTCLSSPTATIWNIG